MKRQHKIGANAKRIYLLATFLLVFTYCNDFVDVELTNSKVSTNIVFGDDNTATSTIIGLYYNLEHSVLFNGSRNSVARLAGLSSDELHDYKHTDGIVQFEENRLSADNANVSNIWNGFYKTIYEANAIIEGVSRATKLTTSVKNQLLGEALFIRAFSHFYLINLFGAVPLITTTDYRQNAVAERNDMDYVYNKIVEDLLAAKELLSDNYISNERLRPNKSTALALLSRVALYREDWQNARDYATVVLDNSVYKLEPDLKSVFLKESKEAIWQIAPSDGNKNTSEALFFVITGAPTYLVLNKSLVSVFGLGDKRRINWIGTYSSASEVVYYPHKYKLYPSTTVSKEYSVIVRLAELYLIRAEANARMGNISNAIADLDMIRSRAGLSKIADTNPSISQDDLILAIESERKLELFSEWGHRWMDLKRSNRAFAVLNSVKSGMTQDQLLYPIPEIEFNRNPQLGLQNPGY